MRRAALLLVVAGAFLAPATPAFAHGGSLAGGGAYRVRVTGVSPPERGLTVGAVEGGALLELANRTGHSVEILGYSGEPYLDVRPDGTYRNVNSPANPTAPPSWRRVSTSTTVRWHDERITPGTWTIPLRVQVRTFDIRGALTREPPPHAWLWWSGAGLLALALTGLASRWPRTIAPVTLIAGLAPISYATSRALDGGTAPLVLVSAGLIAIAAAWRHPPFFQALTGAVLAVFSGLASTGIFSAAVVPAAGPGWLARASVLIALGAGAALTLTGVQRLRATLPAGPDPGRRDVPAAPAGPDPGRRDVPAVPA